MARRPERFPTYQPKNGENVFVWILREAQALREREQARIPPPLPKPVQRKI